MVSFPYTYCFCYYPCLLGGEGGDGFRILPAMTTTSEITFIVVCVSSVTRKLQGRKLAGYTISLVCRAGGFFLRRGTCTITQYLAIPVPQIMSTLPRTPRIPSVSCCCIIPWAGPCRTPINVSRDFPYHSRRYRRPQHPRVSTSSGSVFGHHSPAWKRLSLRPRPRLRGSCGAKHRAQISHTLPRCPTRPG